MGIKDLEYNDRFRLASEAREEAGLNISRIGAIFIASLGATWKTRHLTLSFWREDLSLHSISIIKTKSRRPKTNPGLSLKPLQPQYSHAPTLPRSQIPHPTPTFYHPFLTNIHPLISNSHRAKLCLTSSSVPKSFPSLLTRMYCHDSFSLYFSVGSNLMNCCRMALGLWRGDECSPWEMPLMEKLRMRAWEGV